MKLLVLSGGFGTRLQSAVSSVPKPLAPINGIPFLSFQMDSWVSQGITDFIFLLHYKSDQIIDFLRQWNKLSSNKSISIQFIKEQMPLGTGGSIANAVHKLNLKSNFYVTNADTWIDFGIRSIQESSAPTILITKVSDAGRYGAVVIDDSNYIIKFDEKMNSNSAGWINAGISHLNYEIFLSWDGSNCSLEKDYFPKLAGKRMLHSVTIDQNFIDIGIPEDYDRFCKWIEQDKRKKL